MKSQAFPLTPNEDFGGKVICTPPQVPVSVPADIVQGIDEVKFDVRTLFLSLPLQYNDWQAQRQINVSPAATQQQTTVPGICTFEFRGLHKGGEYFRRFNLATGDQLKLAVETFTNVALRIVDQTGTGYPVVVIATDELTVTTTPVEVSLATIDTVSGIQTVPPGAFSLLSRQSDPDFEWFDLRPSQVETPYPQPLFAGVNLPVAATAYRNAVSPLELIWRIRL